MNKVQTYAIYVFKLKMYFIIIAIYSHEQTAKVPISLFTIVIHDTIIVIHSSSCYTFTYFDFTLYRLSNVKHITPIIFSVKKFN
jgi:hypothetical protein